MARAVVIERHRQRFVHLPGRFVTTLLEHIHQRPLVTRGKTAQQVNGERAYCPGTVVVRGDGDGEVV
jgi:hypothetical protein